MAWTGSRLFPVLAVSALVFATASGATTPPKAPSYPVVHYAVGITLTTHIRSELTDSSGTEIQDEILEWTGHWKDVALMIAPGPKSPRGNAILKAGRPARGSLEASLKFSQHYPDPDNPITCSGRVRESYATILFVAVHSKPVNEADSSASVDKVVGAFDDEVNAEESRQCDGRTVSEGWGLGHPQVLKSPEGVLLEPGVYLSMDWKHKGGTGRVPFPGDRILAGKSFSFKVRGTRTETSGGLTELSEGSATVRFTAK